MVKRTIKIKIGKYCMFAAVSLVVASTALADPDLSVPPGFHIEQIATVPNARAMTWGDEATLFVSSRRLGTVHAISDVLGGDPVVRVIDNDLRVPNGVAFSNGDLYVAEINRILVYRNIEQRLDAPGEPEVVVDNLPGEKLHSWKYIAFGPDGKLYISIGAPCNICDAPDYGLIMRINVDGSGQEVYARGIRNSVGFDWHPVTGAFWFTDNNRDMLGDDEPPGELNQATEAGLHFGFPFCHGADLVEPEAEFAALGRCADAQPPAKELGPHVAPLGVAFYTGVMFPEAYQNQLFIAEHGSWNRSEKIGYRVSLVRLDKAGRKALSYEPFAEGWLHDGKVSGRPVDVLVAPDGSLLVSDDKRGAIYRISYAGSPETE
jgi:glucose/arabinose dehydrogenase